jgi:hypothetical protein
MCKDLKHLIYYRFNTRLVGKGIILNRQETDIGTEKGATVDHVVIGEARITEIVTMTHSLVIRSYIVVKLLNRK